MKKGVVVLACILLAFAFCVPAVAQPSTKAVETSVIDNFDTPDEKEWTWKVSASRFATKDEETGTQYPLINYFNGISNSLRPYRKDGDPDPMVLGVKAKYDRKGDNWFEIYPEYKDKKDKNGEPLREIPFIGTVSQIDFWAWGANYLYFIEIMVRDANGRVHIIPAGNLRYQGWKDIVVNIPTYIIQHSRLRSGPANMTLVGFRVYSDGNEYVDDFAIYLDQLKYTTNTLANIYDGYELRNSDFGDNNDSSSSTSNAK